MQQRKKGRTRSTRTEPRSPSPSPPRPKDIAAALRRQLAFEKKPPRRPRRRGAAPSPPSPDPPPLPCQVAPAAAVLAPVRRSEAPVAGIPAHIDPLIELPPPVQKLIPSTTSEEAPKPPPLPSQIDFAIDVLAAMPIWIVIRILAGATLALAGVVFWETVGFVFRALRRFGMRSRSPI